MKDQERTEEQRCGIEYDGAAWYGAGHIRIVRCGLPRHGRDVDHDEMTDGEAGIVTWEWADPPEPKRWELPPEPGPEVTRISCKLGVEYVRDPSEPRYWQQSDAPNPYSWPWPDLLSTRGPLSDASPSHNGGER